MGPYYPLDYRIPNFSKADVYLAYGDVYKDAIEILMDKFSKDPPLHDYSLIPVLALLRHYIEIKLKGIIMYCKNPVEQKPIPGHNILDLYKKAHDAVDKKYSIPQPHPQVVEFIEQLGKFDPEGQVFRYHESKDGKDFYENIDPILRRRIISLSEIRKTVDQVLGDLEGLEGYLDYQKDQEQENFSNL